MITLSDDNGGWIKSSLSFANGNCVEVQFLTDGGVQVRNSRDPGQGVLAYTRDEWEAFLGGVRLGEFDLGREREARPVRHQATLTAAGTRKPQPAALPPGPAARSPAR